MRGLFCRLHPFAHDFMNKIQKHLNILKPESGVTLIELLIVMAVIGVLGILIYDLHMSILTSNLFVEVKNDLAQQGQQALNEIKNRMTASRLLLADKYIKGEPNPGEAWDGIGSYYVALLESNPPNRYPPLPTITPNSPNPATSGYHNVIARIESRMVSGKAQVIRTLIPSDPNEPERGLSATSIGNSILFIEALPSRKVTYTWSGPPNPQNPTTDFRIDTYRLNYYYLSQGTTNQVAGKNYVDLIQWESERFADYNQLVQIDNYIKQASTQPNSESLANIISQLKDRTKDPTLTPICYAWDVSKAGSIDDDSTSVSNITTFIRGNFYDMNANGTLTTVGSTFLIPRSFEGTCTSKRKREALPLMRRLATGATQGRVPYTIAFNNNNKSNLDTTTLIPGNVIPHVVPIRFNPYDTTSNYASSKFMGGFEIGIITNPVGYQVNMRLVLMAESALLRRMISHETVVLVAPRN